MTSLTVWRDTDPGAPEVHHTEWQAVAETLAAAGVLFERWKASIALPHDIGQEVVEAAYKNDIARLRAARG